MNLNSQKEFKVGKFFCHLLVGYLLYNYQMLVIVDDVNQCHSKITNATEKVILHDSFCLLQLCTFHNFTTFYVTVFPLKG